MPAEELQCLYVVIKGQIEQSLDCEFVASYVGSNHADGLNNNDWFDSRRLPESLTKDNQLEPESTPIQPYQFRASEETLLLQVAGDAIDKISAQNHLVRQMLSDKLPERLKALRQRRHNKTLDPASYTNQQEVQQIMLQPVINVHLLPVHIVDANSSLYEAARIMTKAGLKHVLVRPIHSLEGLNDVNSSNDLDSSQTAQLETRLLLGILTDTDICRAVSDKQDPATTPCQRYANFNLRTIKASDEISDALLTMTRYRIHRLPVIDKSGDVVGVLGQSDMLAHIGHHSQLISIQIEQAQDLSARYRC
ncbi:cyclic nucleotide-binding/CBS domain-containing protein [Psychrobacter sp. JCM 18901]|uniref:CBS domain-containing protein n=1 Tax=Psychrobacter sp. JCM 18901 TaxID=1298609 RepID=UPI0021C260C5|nr:CBS domain-containing protein [Psychrobacter sp. JCM 18901]